VVELSPGSKADRAKLDMLQQQTGRTRASWLQRAQRVRPAALGGGAAAMLILVTSLFALARSSGPREEPRPRLEDPTARSGIVPSPAISYSPPPAPTPSVQPPPGAMGVGAFPSRTITNGAPPQVTHMAVAPPAARPPSRPAPRPQPTFLAPAPVRAPVPRARTGEGSLTPPPGGGSPPVLPEAGSSNPPARSDAPRGEYLPPPSTSAAPADRVAGSSINIRRLDEESAPPAASAPSAPEASGQPSPPSLAEAQYHYGLANQYARRGDFATAYNELEYARELFRAVNVQGGADGLLAAEGFRVCSRAMQELLALRR
jgi:hypothetical protein